MRGKMRDILRQERKRSVCGRGCEGAIRKRRPSDSHELRRQVRGKRTARMTNNLAVRGQEKRKGGGGRDKPKALGGGGRERRYLLPSNSKKRKTNLRSASVLQGEPVLSPAEDVVDLVNVEPPLQEFPLHQAVTRVVERRLCMHRGRADGKRNNKKTGNENEMNNKNNKNEK